MNTCSLLYLGEPSYDVCGADALYADVHIGQIVDAATEGKESFELEPLYAQKPRALADVLFRQDIVRDLEGGPLREGMTAFAQGMFMVRRCLSYSAEIRHPQQKDKWLLDAAARYIRTLEGLTRALASANPASSGMRRFAAWLEGYMASAPFAALSADTTALCEAFAAMTYGVTIDMTAESAFIHDDAGTEDFCAFLMEAFGPLADGAFDEEVGGFTDINLSFFELKVLDILLKRHPGPFERLAAFGRRHARFLDDTVSAFDREAQFYMTYLAYMDGLMRKGFTFCLPAYTDAPAVRVVGGYDMSLAQKEGMTARAVAANDFVKEADEGAFILTGPNQGGKTTFARTLGQILYFGALGLPVPCTSASLCHYGRLHTHFAIEEDLSTGYGRLKEELIRLRAVLDALGGNDVVLFNELFATTTTYDALNMGARLLGALEGRVSLCLYVTHIYELSSLSERTVSLVAQTEGGTPTYRVLRAAADARAHADALLVKHGLTYDAILERKA